MQYSHTKSVRVVKNIAFGVGGGWVICLYFTATAIVYALSIVGIKKAYVLLKCAAFCLAPYGKNAYIDFMSHKFGNAFWAITTGWEASFICILCAGLWYATVFGAYIGSRFFHLAQYAIAPFGAKCYPTALLTGGESTVVKLREEHNFEL